MEQELANKLGAALARQLSENVQNNVLIYQDEKNVYVVNFTSWAKTSVIPTVSALPAGNPCPTCKGTGVVP